jgi:hypothetical protein
MAPDIADQDRIQSTSTDWGRTAESGRAETSAAREVPERAPSREAEVKSTAEASAGGSLGQAIGGAAAVVLAIVGLANFAPSYMMSIGVIVLGAALLLKGFSIVSRFRALLTRQAQVRAREAEFGGGMTAEFLGGAAGIVLGILALIGVVPDILCSVAVIGFGMSLILGTGLAIRLNRMENRAEEPWTRTLIQDITDATAGIQALVGLAAIVLGILGLVQVVPVTLTLVAILCVGASVLAGSAVTGRMVSVASQA